MVSRTVFSLLVFLLIVAIAGTGVVVSAVTTAPATLTLRTDSQRFGKELGIGNDARLSSSPFFVLNKGGSSENTILVKATLGQYSGYWILDTGFTYCVINVPGGTGSTTTLPTQSSFLQTNGSYLTVTTDRVNTQKYDLSGYSSGSYRPLVGILGVSFLRNFSTALDFDAYTMTLRSPACTYSVGERKRKANGSIGGFQYIYTPVSYGETAQRSCFLDTGSSFSVLSTSSGMPVGGQLTGQTVRTLWQNQTLSWNLVRYPFLRLGPVEVKDDVWLSMTNGVRGTSFERYGAIGYSTLRKFKSVAINFSDASLTLTPRNAPESAKFTLKLAMQPRVAVHTTVALKLGHSMLMQTV